MNGDNYQFGYWDETINQALQNAFLFVNDEEKLIDRTIKYDKSVYELAIKQYELRWYVIQKDVISEKPNSYIEQMNDYLDKTQLIKYDFTKTKKYVWQAVSYVTDNTKIPEKVKEYFLKDYNESIKQLWKLKNIDKLVKTLKGLRKYMSYWLWWDKPDEYYVKMLVSQQFTHDILIKASVIHACFEDTLNVNGKDYPKWWNDK